jgi:hypothetical protein
MTKDEIRLVVFILSALIVGAIYRHWRMENPTPPPEPPAPVSKKWAKPPYVFKNRAEMEQAARNVEAEDRAYATKQNVNPPPSHQPQPSSPSAE